MGNGEGESKRYGEEYQIGRGEGKNGNGKGEREGQGTGREHGLGKKIKLVEG